MTRMIKNHQCFEANQLIAMQMKTNIKPTPQCKTPTLMATFQPCAPMVFFLCLLAGLALPPLAVAQSQPDLATTSETFSGTITELKAGELAVRMDDGRIERYSIQDASSRAVSVAGKAYNIPADIELVGEVPMELVERGVIVQFQALCTSDRKYAGLVTAAKVIDEADMWGDRSVSGKNSRGDKTKKQATSMQIKFLEQPADDAIPARVEVVGRVLSFASNKLHLQIQPSRWAPEGRIQFEFSTDAKLILGEHSLDRVVLGDTVRMGQALVFETGEKVIQRVRISATGKRDSLTKSYHGKLENKFRHLSNQPSKPRELRSAHFVLQTDLSDRSGNILLAKLETMFDLVSGYYRQQPRQPIECYIVRDLANWPTGLDETAAEQIREGSGLTVIQRLGTQTKAVVYACDDHAIAQHEAVHAFCAQTFGGIGPVWYAEGMAELGQYWRPATVDVSIDPVVVSYLKNSPAQKLTDIVAADQITGDSWQAYAWRWATCHLLANNPNYAARFKTLGVNLMTGQTDSLEVAFENQLEQMSFEYDLFLKNLGNGYRVDLCRWDWKTSSQGTDGNEPVGLRGQGSGGVAGDRVVGRTGPSLRFRLPQVNGKSTRRLRSMPMATVQGRGRWSVFGCRVTK